MKSMTGYGRSALNLPSHLISIEVSSVNKRGLEVVFSSPKEWQAFEQTSMAFLRKSLERGRIRVTVSAEQARSHDNDVALFNESDLENDLNHLKKFLEGRGYPWQVSPELVLQLSQLRKREAGLPLLKEILPQLEECLREATEQMILMREKEGGSIFADLSERTKLLEEMVNKMEEGSREMASEWKGRLMERLSKAELSLDSDDERVLKEVALFAEKCDVSEEISRLRSHLVQIGETLRLNGSIGRKLEFLLQEIGRELNTFCSKSTRTQCTSIALEARAELEKMREQSMNVE